MNIPYAQPMANPYGATFAVPARPQPKAGTPLTQEDINHLRQLSGSENLDIRISNDDLLISRCTHRDKNGAQTLVNLGGNKFRCTICNQEFDLVECTVEQVESNVNAIVDILQSMKTLYLDAPEKFIADYCQLIPLLQKLPGVWKATLNNFSKYENWNATPEFNNNGYFPGFAAMANLLTGQFMPGAGMYGAPQGQMGYGYPQQQPMMAQPNMYAQAPQVATPQPTAGYYQQPMMAQPDMTGNPMAYGMPAAPVAPAPGVMPTAPAPAAAVAPQTEVQQTQVFNV